MKREIKFRAWENSSQSMWDVRELEWAEGEILSAYLGLHSNDISDIEIMQFTGIRDAGGKDIYEGDIVEFGLQHWTPSKAEIIFDRGAFCFRHSKDDTYYSDIKYCEDANVVGNIHANPDLLKL